MPTPSSLAGSLQHKHPLPALLDCSTAPAKPALPCQSRRAGSCMALRHWDGLPMATARPDQCPHHGEPLPSLPAEGLGAEPSSKGESKQQPVKSLLPPTESQHMMQRILRHPCDFCNGCYMHQLWLLNF